MHDPLTVCFEIKYPWKRKPTKFFPNGYRDTFITIWHKDPCKDCTDNSCDWFGSKKPLDNHMKLVGEWVWNMESIFNNRPYYPDTYEHKEFLKLQEIVINARKRSRFRWHPRYHFWHWRIQIHPLQKLKRYLFERCSICGGRYRYGYSPMGNWAGTKTWHHNCDRSLNINKGSKIDE